MPGLLESLNITAAHMTPDHLASVLISFMLNSAEFVGIIQQINNLAGKLNMITNWKQPAPAVSEQFPGM